MTKYELKQQPTLKAFINRAIPSYRKHNVYVSAFSSRNINSYWDGGSKSDYTLVDLNSMRTLPLPSSSHPYFDVARYTAGGENDSVSVDRAGNITLKVLPPNTALIETGYFCGKPSTAHIFVNADNLPRLLPAASEVRGARMTSTRKATYQIRPSDVDTLKWARNHFASAASATFMCFVCNERRPTYIVMAEYTCEGAHGSGSYGVCLTCIERVVAGNGKVEL